MITLEEKEQNLIEEVDFFNRNVRWWEAEIDKVTQRLMKLELSHNFDCPSDSEERDKLVAQFTYLAAKANTEHKAASSIENKIRKLNLEKELQFIQGDFEDSKKKLRKRG